MDIFPALLEKNPCSLLNHIKKLSPFFSHFQIDIADGVFVPSKTVSVEAAIKKLSLSNSSILNKSFDFHLMVKDYKKELAKLTQLSRVFSIHTVFIHINALGSKHNCLSDQFRIGLVLDPENTVADNWTTISKYPATQIMTVGPGFQGGEFLKTTLNKIDKLRQSGYEGKIYLDGGINNTTLSYILNKDNLPDTLCIGSYLTESTQERLKKLQRLITTRSKPLK